MKIENKMPKDIEDVNRLIETFLEEYELRVYPDKKVEIRLKEDSKWMKLQ